MRESASMIASKAACSAASSISTSVVIIDSVPVRACTP
jgi:hypothetical protein